MRKHGLPALMAVLSILFAACEDPTETVPVNTNREPVVVFVAFEHDASLRELFASYSEETGVRVIVRSGISWNIVNDVIENKVSPPADLLLTGSVTDIWRAAEEGALRPLSSATAEEKVPQWLRDPDDYWVALSYQTAVLAFDPDVFADSNLTGTGSLHESQFHGRLCLSSSANPINQATIAMLIGELGVRDTQNLVRGWMANLAQPVFDTADQLLAAINAGDCGIGIVSSQTVAQAASGDSHVRFAVHNPVEAYAEIEAVGLARHAHNPQGAAVLVEWLLSREAQQRHSSKTSFLAATEAPRNTRNVSLVAWHEVEAIKLAERVQYR